MHADWEGPAPPGRRGGALLLGALLAAGLLAGRVLGPGSDGLAVAPAPAAPLTAPAPATAPMLTATPWTPLEPSVLSPREGHTAVWGLGEMLVWGGSGPTRAGPQTLRDGAAYQPRTGRWAPLPPAPLTGRSDHSAVWTGRQMLIWGGRHHGATRLGRGLPDGAAYDPVARRWRRLPDAPLSGRSFHTAVWTGREMLVWGSFGTRPAGAAYTPQRRRWRLLPPAPIAPRIGHSAVWTGAEMIVWGGSGGARVPVPQAGGAAYDPRAGRWRRLPDGPLASRTLHSAVWTGEEMIVWGGLHAREGGPDPAPVPRSSPPAGSPAGPPPGPLADGAAYNPATNGWRRIPQPPVAGRFGHAAVWTGSRMVVAGGLGEDHFHPDGATYDLATGRWRALGDAPLVAPTRYPAVWSGRSLLLWGGQPTAAGAAMTTTPRLANRPLRRPYPR